MGYTASRGIECLAVPGGVREGCAAAETCQARCNRIPPRSQSYVPLKTGDSGTRALD